MRSNDSISDIERGWAFSSKMLGENASSQAASTYVARVNKAIETVKDNLMKISTGLEDAQMGGFVAEEWHAGTFNVDAIAAGSRSEAIAGKPGVDSNLNRNYYASVDVRIQKGDRIIEDYGSKYNKDFKSTARNQAALNPKTGNPKYEKQTRLVPSDQVDQVREYAINKAEDPKTNENRAKAYKETSKAVDRISDGKNESKPLSKSESEELAREIKNDELDLERHDLNADSAIKPEYIMKQAIKAGFSAATVTIIMQMAPELFKAISYLIKTGELDLNQVKNTGIKAISASAEGFLRGSIACSLQILCEKGTLGVAMKSVDATVLGTVVALTLETVKNSILVAAGRLKPNQMGETLIDGVMISTGYIVGKEIGGFIGQALGFELPVIGYMLGSLVGCAFAAVYGIGKKKLISFCIDTGFTCFGLVDQDYTLPEVLLREMGIDCTPITRTNVSLSAVDRIQLSNNVDPTSIDTINISIIKRGIIGVNKVGYVI